MLLEFKEGNVVKLSITPLLFLLAAGYIVDKLYPTFEVGLGGFLGGTSLLYGILLVLMEESTYKSN